MRRRTVEAVHVGIEVIAAGSGFGEGQGGASGYIEGIVPELLAEPRVERLTAYVGRAYQPAAGWSHPKLRVRMLAVPSARPGRVAFEQTAVPLYARSDAVDVLFSTGNFRPLSYRRPNVLALHAIQHFLLNDDIGRVRSAYVRFAVPRSARSADMVVAVTETLRQDAIRVFGLDPTRIVSVPMGPSPWVLRQAQANVGGAEPYLLDDGSPYVLCISRLYALKNHARLIRAFARLVRDERIRHKLVIVGGDADVTRAQLARLARSERVHERIRFLGRVPQEQVPALYAGADAVAYVSLYETFGHPVLEAFATGRALVTTATGGTGEVADGAARLVDPTDVNDIALGLRDVLLDEQLRARLTAAGRQRVRDFSWERCARGTVDAFAEALRRRGHPDPAR
jgi:glycosyltransferase involved in cell wall biosynthesis